jgi:sortase A
VRRNVQVLGWTLIWSGVFIFGYLGYQLFVTDLINAGVQAEAADDLEEAFATEDSPEIEEIDPVEYVGPDGTLPPDTPELIEFHPMAPVETGASIAFLRIPRIDVDEVLFEGVDRQTLKDGPGHMESTPLPGEPGNSVVSGHRTTHGRPFFDFDLLVVGDDIEVETDIGTHVYRVREMRIVGPTDVWVTDNRPGGWMTFTTCHPKFSARERLVVWAEMILGPNYEFIQLHEVKFG